MFDEGQRKTALDFANALAKRDYSLAYSLCSESFRTGETVNSLQKRFEEMIPLDWGAIDPIEIENVPGLPQQPFVYVSLGGDCYSEAIIISSFVVESGGPRIDQFEFGRP